MLNFQADRKICYKVKAYLANRPVIGCRVQANLSNRPVIGCTVNAYFEILLSID